ncbi:MAG TPA: ADOP family duplicated permease [Vicinamibacteria bacterium]|nr:ADOP family duplicated permease [Vicinamibacteria bacterium]
MIYRELFRGLTRQRGSSVLVVLLVAIGVSLSTSIFAVVDSVLLNPLPYTQSDRLVTPWCVARSFGVDKYPFSWDNYRDYRDRVEAFEGVAAMRIATMTLEGEDHPASVNGARVTANLFEVLDVEPVLGRLFEDDIERAPEVGVALISHALWQRAFGGESDVIGRGIRLDGRPHTVVGVLPAYFRFPRSDSEVFVPLAIEGPPESDRAFHFLRLVARLEERRSIEEAQEQIETVAAQLAEAYPDGNRNLSARVIPLKDELVGTSKRSLETLFSAVQLLFVIAWTNVAILLLVQGMARRGELELRAALGATRVRLFALLLSRAGLLAALGCGLGLLAGSFGLLGLRGIDPVLLPRAYEIELTFELVLWAVCITLLAALAFGTLPAWAALTTTRTIDLKRKKLSGRLVAVQVALAIPLLVASTMQLRSVRALAAVETGFDVDDILVAGVALPVNQFDLPGQKRYIDRAVAVLGEIPGVVSVAAMSHPPLTQRQAAIVTYRPDQAGQSGLPNAHYRVISEGLLRTLGIPIFSGREFEPRDEGGSRPIVILDAKLAKTLFEDRDPVGQKVRLGTAKTLWEVVGVAGEAQLVSLDKEPDYTVYVPILQNLFPAALNMPEFVLRTEGRPETLASSVRAALQEVDPNQAVLDVRPMESQLDDWLSERRAVSALLWGIAAAALVLAGACIYATLAFAVRYRLREMAIRAALGAGSARLARAVVSDGLRPGLVGIVAGLAFAGLGGRFLMGVLYGVSVLDVPSLVAAAGLMFLAMVAACIAPARRAVHESPTRLLREDVR